MKKVKIILTALIISASIAQTQGQVILAKEWIVVEIGKEKITVDVEKTPWIKLSEGRVSGFSGCNRLMGSYTLGRKDLTFSQLTGTKMFCFDTQELEDKFTQTLKKTHYWKYKRRELYFLDKDKEVIMKFKMKK